MKHKLLSLIALAGAMFMSTSAMAQWTEPEEPAMPTTAGEFAIGKNFFVRNVGAGQFITGANDWSTKISLTTGEPETSPALVITAEELTLTYNGVEVSGLGLKLNGTFTVTGASGNRTFTNTYLFRDSEEFGFIDWGSQEKGRVWNVTKAGNYYRIQTAAADPNYPNAASQYAGWVTEDGLTIEDGAPTAVYFNLTAEDENIDWEFVPCDEYMVQKEAYSARVELYELLVSTTELSYTVDTSAATEVYNNPNATKEQIDAAIGKLKYDINSKKYEADWAGASEDNPLDVTEDCLVNPDFETGDISGWTTNYVSGQQANNIGYQGASYTNGNVTISKFIEAWKNDGSPWTIGDGYLEQTVYGLPQGKYVLECDAVSNYQWADHSADGGIGKNPAEGVFLFIKAGQYEAKTTLATGNGQPEHFTVTFINDGSESLTFGLKTESATANWIAADNFRITYYGKSDDSPELANLKEALKQANELAEEVAMNNIESTDDINVSEEARQGLNAAIKQGEAAVTGDADAQIAATEVINTAIAAVNESKKVYAQYKAVYESGNETLNNLMASNQWPELQEEIEIFLEDDLLVKFNDGTLTAEELEEYQNKISDMIRAFISDPSKIQEGDDLTFLLVNPHFRTGTTANPTGWVINSGSMTELRTSTHNIETWHKTFDISQTIPNMPAGVYDITLQGFVRHDGGDTENTWLYGGISKVKLFDLFEETNQMREEPLFTADTPDHPAMGDSNYDASRTEGYVPNGMTGSYYWFKEINPNTNEPYYTNHVEVVLDKDGDLTIGIHSESTTDWVIFDNFGIKYAGMNVAVFAKMVAEKQLELSTLVEDIEAEDPFAIADDVNKVVAEKLAINADDIDNADDALAAIDEIDAAIKLVKESKAAYLSVGEVIEYFEELVADYSPDASMDDAIAAASANYYGGYATVDAMKADEKALAAAWAPAMSKNIEAGEDATAIILNPHYDGLIREDGVSGEEFWTSTSWHGLDFLTFEFFNWRNADDPEVTEGNNLQFQHYQELNGIKPGYYTVSVEGFYRYGDYNPNEKFGTPGAGNAHADGTEVLNAKLYVISSAGSDAVALKSIFDGAQSEKLGVGSEVEAEGMPGVFIPNNMEAAAAYFDQNLYTNEKSILVGEDGKLTIGISKSEAIDSDWTIFTDWKLFYHGDTMPDAVQDLNAKTSGIVVIYGIDGRQQNQLRRGINIVRSNGKVNKVIVK